MQYKVIILPFSRDNDPLNFFKERLPIKNLSREHIFLIKAITMMQANQPEHKKNQRSLLDWFDQEFYITPWRINTHMFPDWLLFESLLFIHLSHLIYVFVKRQIKPF